MVTPAIREFHRQYPQAEIDFLSSAGGAEILASNPHLSRILVLRHRNLPYCLSLEKQKLVDEIRSRQYDVVVLLESASRYRQLLELAGISEMRSFATVPFIPTLHNIVNYLRVSGLEASTGRDSAPPYERGTSANLGADRESVVRASFLEEVAPNISLDMQLTSSADALQSAEALLYGLPKPIVAIHPGYGPSNKKKDQANRLRGWNPQKFARVAQQLSSSDASIVLTGSADDVPLCEYVAQES